MTNAQGRPNLAQLGELLTPADVSAYLGVPQGTLANWRYQRRGPAFLRIGRHVRYRSEDLAGWIEDCAAKGEAHARVSMQSSTPAQEVERLMRHDDAWPVGCRERLTTIHQMT